MSGDENNTKPEDADSAASIAPASIPPTSITPGSIPPPDGKKSGAAVEAEKLIAAADSTAVAAVAHAMFDEKDTTAIAAARIVDELATRKAELLAPLVDKLVAALCGRCPRAILAAANALPAVAKVAPAKVAKHMEALATLYPRLDEIGRDGLVRTFTTLCAASVAYQKRLEPTLSQAMRDADPKYLLKWAEHTLPSLKGEPHANVRAVVEERTQAGLIPRPQAQKLADLLGIKLRGPRP